MWSCSSWRQKLISELLVCYRRIRNKRRLESCWEEETRINEGPDFHSTPERLPSSGSPPSVPVSPGDGDRAERCLNSAVYWAFNGDIVSSPAAISDLTGLLSSLEFWLVRKTGPGSAVWVQTVTNEIRRWFQQKHLAASPHLKHKHKWACHILHCAVVLLVLLNRDQSVWWKRGFRFPPGSYETRFVQQVELWAPVEPKLHLSSSIIRLNLNSELFLRGRIQQMKEAESTLTVCVLK